MCVHWNWSEKGWWNGKSDSSCCPVFLNDNLWAGGDSGGGVEPFIWVSARPCWGCEQVPAKYQSIKVSKCQCIKVSKYQIICSTMQILWAGTSKRAAVLRCWMRLEYWITSSNCFPQYFPHNRFTQFCPSPGSSYISPLPDSSITSLARFTRILFPSSGSNLTLLCPSGAQWEAGEECGGTGQPWSCCRAQIFLEWRKLDAKTAENQVRLYLRMISSSAGLL